MDEILDFLKKSRVEESTLKKLVVPALYNFGYKTIADLQDLEKTDLNIEGRRNSRIVHWVVQVLNLS